jgi:glutamate racemase
MRSAPIAIFDSGLGGLSVTQEIARLLPREHLIYLADSAHCPYGGRPLEEIRSLSLSVAGVLVERGAKVLVVACNTASGAALETLREILDIPVVGLEPALKPAARRSTARRVGVLATTATLRTERFRRLVERFGRGVEVFAQGCPGLVELVENGETEGPRVREALAPYLRRMTAAGVDAVVLGCTHYPFLRDEIAAGLGPGVEIHDSGLAVARQLRRVLRRAGRLAPAGNGPGRTELLTTGDPDEVAGAARRLLRRPIDASHVDLDYEPGQESSSGAATSAVSER